MLSAMALPSPAHAATATFRKSSDWYTGYVGEMAIRNNQTNTITSWRVTFQLPEGTTIASHWSSTLTREGPTYVFTNASWNGTLNPGGTTGFGFIAHGPGAPLNCTVNGEPCEGAGPDVTPPTSPTNLQGSPWGKLTWNASTDDRGVVAYELMNGTNVQATITGTSYTYTGPPPPPTIYYMGVRAVDAAGNRSPVTAVPDGMTDTVPPATPTNLTMGGPSGGWFTIRWTTPPSMQLVAGYEVYLNGALVRKVGGTTAYVPFSGFGTYLVTVRAYDPAGNVSAFARIGIAVDPPPPGTP